MLPRRIPNTFVMSHEDGAGRRARKLPGQRHFGPCGNKCMIFRRKAGASINETAVSRGQSLVRRGGWGADERGWARMGEDGRGPLL